MPSDRVPGKTPPDPWLELTVCGGLLEAQLLQTRLESSGIRVRLKYETAARLFGLTLDGLGKIQVLVPQSQREDALEVLNAPEVEEEDDTPSPDTPEAPES